MFRGSVFTMAALMALLSVVSGPAASQSGETSWPQFRGPNRDEISTDRNLLRAWPKQGPPLAWKAQGVGEGFSSVAVAGGKVFTMGNRGSDSYVYALDK